MHPLSTSGVSELSGKITFPFMATKYVFIKILLYFRAIFIELSSAEYL